VAASFRNISSAAYILLAEVGQFGPEVCIFIWLHAMQYLYLPSATVLKRWAGDTASTLFVHVDETLQGMDVIRAFNAVPYFIQVSRCCRRCTQLLHK
jgi:hypothetical protein